MKIKAIASAFKTSKTANIVNVADSGVQWITNRAAWYSMDGMPTFTGASLLNVFDVPEEKQADWNSELTSTTSYLFDESKTQELQEMKMQIKWFGETYVLLKDEYSFFAIDEKYLKPLYDEWEYLRYVAYPVQHGRTTIILCYVKLELKAAILPVVLADNLTKELSDFLTLTFEGGCDETS